MVRKAERLSFGSLVLDSQALSLLIQQDRRLLAYIHDAREHNIDVVTTAMTVIEVQDGRFKSARLDWVLSTLLVRDVTLDIAKAASELLREVGMHGHRHAIDAVVAAVAMREPGAVVVLTSDPDDMQRLCERDQRITIDRV